MAMYYTVTAKKDERRWNISEFVSYVASLDLPIHTDEGESRIVQLGEEFIDMWMFIIVDTYRRVAVAADVNYIQRDHIEAYLNRIEERIMEGDEDAALDYGANETWAALRTIADEFRLDIWFNR